MAKNTKINERRDKIMNKIFRYILMFVFLLSSIYGARSGDIIENVAGVTYTIGDTKKNVKSNKVETEISQTPATIEFLKYDNSGKHENLGETKYGPNGTEYVMIAATLPDGTVVTVPSEVGMSGTDTYGGNDLVIIRVIDIDQNINMNIRDTIVVTVINPVTGEKETLTLMETDLNSGVFVGYMHTTIGDKVDNDGKMSVSDGANIEATYIDNGTDDEVKAEAIIVQKSELFFANKEQSKDVASIGEYLQYTVTVENLDVAVYRDVTIYDQLPKGIKYKDGSFKLNGAISTPTISSDGKRLSIVYPQFKPSEVVTISYVAMVTAGIENNEAINRAWVESIIAGSSNVASVRLKIERELQNDRGMIIGGVYDKDGDCNETTAQAMNENDKIRRCGVEGVKLYMEDGRYVVTDKNGKYHFVDIMSGTHVLQIDKYSLQGRYKLTQCKQNTRWAGSNKSKFVDMFHGGMRRVDFCVEKIAGVATSSRFDLKLSKVDDSQVVLEATLGSTKGLTNPELYLSLPDGVEYLDGSVSGSMEVKRVSNMLVIAFADQKSIKLTLESPDGVMPSGDIKALLYYDTQLEKNNHTDVAMVSLGSSDSGDLLISKSHADVSVLDMGGNTPLGKGDYSWVKPTSQKKMPKYSSDDVDKLGNNPAIVWPPKGWVPSIPSTRVAVLYPKGGKIELTHNGYKINPANYEGIFRGSNGMQIVHYKGVDLAKGSNVFKAVIKDSSGRVIATDSREIFVESGMPQSVELVEEYSHLKDDGKHAPIVAVRFRGVSGHLLRGGLVGSFETDSGHRAVQMSNGRGQYTIDSQGIAYIKIKPLSSSSKTKLRFKLADGSYKTIEVKIKSQPRDWILVGFAEGSVGYGKVSAHMESLGSSKDEYYNNGRVAFFAKGRIKGEWLMTMSYDTGRRDDDREMFDDIDPDAYYTLYNDATEQGNEAPSRRKLYLKLEKNDFSVMFGDYDTKLDKTDLSSYNRSFTGVKSEYNGKNVDINLFAANTDQLFFRDEIRPDGTSGYYYLSNKDIIDGSEEITIEIRDRHKAHTTKRVVTLHRYSDYDIDYNKGRIYFKNPIHRNTQEFDPQYIVVKYEVDGRDGDNYSYGGRVALKSDDKRYEIGATYISEDRGKQDARLMGADATFRISKKTRLRGEYAESKNSDEDGYSTAVATKVELEHRDDNVSWLVYYREQDEAFGLGQLSDSLRGTRKIGVDVRARFGKKLYGDLSVYQNREYGVDREKDENVVQAGVTYESDSNYSVSLGYRYADGTYTKATHQLLGRFEYRLLEDRLKVWLQQEQSIGENEDYEFPTRTEIGAEYSYDDNASFRGAMERLDRDGEISWQSRIGMRYKLWGDTTLKLDRVYEAHVDKSRVYDVLGVLKEWKQSEQLKIRLGYEKAMAQVDYGEDDGDEFDAFRFGVDYTGKKFSSRLDVEYRDGTDESKINLDAGVYIERSKSTGLAFGLGYHKWWGDNGSGQDIDAKLGYVYRPQSSDWIVLDRFDYKRREDSDKEFSEDKFINNLHVNYEPDASWQFALQYGLKYVVDEFDGDKYKGWVDLFGADARYDISERWTIGLQGSMLHAYDANNYEYGVGAYVDTTVWDNTTLRVGYNASGFEDDDFSDQNYHRDGVYMMFRVKFDQDSVKSLLREVN